MYDALKPIYTTLFQVIDEKFGPIMRGSNVINRSDSHIEVFKHLDRGWGRLTKSNAPGTEFPYGALDFGQVSEVKTYRSPEGYQYKLTYPLIIITHEGVIRPATETTVKVFKEANDPKRGIGDIISIIGSYMFKSHHTSRFQIAETDTDENPDGLAPWEWNIVDWTQDVCDCNFMPAKELLSENPLCRGTQLNFHFNVTETKPL